jgi:hypothetical protein
VAGKLGAGVGMSVSPKNTRIEDHLFTGWRRTELRSYAKGMVEHYSESRPPWNDAQRDLLRDAWGHAAQRLSERKSGGRNP